MGARLSALIVNYKSGAYSLALAAGLQRQWAELGRLAGDLEIAVVDNASPCDQTRELSGLEQLGARVVRSAANLGYAAGMNLALRETHGAPGDPVLVLNPDLALFPGSLARMLETFAETPRIGALGPRAFLDPLRTWCMPPNRLPTPEGESLAARALHDPEVAAVLSAERTRHALIEWTARSQVEVEMLSGACLMLSREAIARAGGLFDERYPLYFEDTDLFRRLERAGLCIVLEPRAEIVHHWARSSGIEAGDSEPARLERISRAAYFERWFAASERGSPFPAETPSRTTSANEAPGFRALGDCLAPPQFEFPRAGRWLVELAMVPSFPLAAGAIVEGAQWRMDERVWEWFYRGRYFARAVDPENMGVAVAWSFEKTSVARSVPLEPRELRGEIAAPQ